MISTNIAQEYRQIYDDIMGAAIEGVILTYDSASDVYDYFPFSHNTEDDCIEQLGELMRKNLLFYCYGEDEIVNQHQEGKFSALERAAKFAYKNRLPQRSPNNEGLQVNWYWICWSNCMKKMLINWQSVRLCAKMIILKSKDAISHKTAFFRL